ncbi:hypothetical protein [Kitasatospora sp. NPDC058190]|uniref:hypothetical protein n=1 Tax=Kitasatospora sp. NPDC058190 TaxID=3346371 RepID=UPI0036DAD01C
MLTRTLTVAAAGIGATVLAATGITYASPSGSTSVLPSVQQPTAQPGQPAAPPAQQAAPAPAPAAAAAGGGSAGGEKNAGGGHDNGGHDNGGGGGRDNGGRDNGGGGGGGRDNGGGGGGGRDNGGGGGGRDNGGGGGGREGGGREGGGREGGGREGGGREGGGREGGGREGGGRGHHKEGRIFINERTYSAGTEGCITAASGLGARSFNIRNESWRTVEVFRGFNCDNGGPVAVVGPHSSNNGVRARGLDEDEWGGDWDCEGVVGSFRVIGHHREW